MKLIMLLGATWCNSSNNCTLICFGGWQIFTANKTQLWRQTAQYYIITGPVQFHHDLNICWLRGDGYHRKHIVLYSFQGVTNITVLKSTPKFKMSFLLRNMITHLTYLRWTKTQTIELVFKPFL